METTHSTSNPGSGKRRTLNDDDDEIVEIDGPLTGAKRVNILENNLLPTVRAMAVPESHTFKFVHDNSSIHGSRVVKNLIRQHPEIMEIEWPTKECDINPIENLWVIMTRDWKVGNDMNIKITSWQSKLRSGRHDRPKGDDRNSSHHWHPHCL